MCYVVLIYDWSNDAYDDVDDDDDDDDGDDSNHWFISLQGDETAKSIAVIDMNGVGMADLAGKISSLSMNVYWMMHVTVNDDNGDDGDDYDGYDDNDDNSGADNHIDCDELWSSWWLWIWWLW